MDPITAKILALVDILKGNKSVFVPWALHAPFNEACRDLHIVNNGGLANREGQYFYLD